ncbi:MAG: integrase core domain-containing protein [Bacteroidota bacterium]
MNKNTDITAREKIFELRQQGVSCSLIADQLGLSLSLVKKWSAKTQRGEFGGLPGRPVIGALGSFAPGMVQRIKKLREAHAGWGPYFLRAELLKEGYDPDELPACSSIARYLNQEGLARPYRRHGGVVLAKPPMVKAPHDCWQMDAKGAHQVDSIGHIGLINLKDWDSRLHLIAYPARVPGSMGHCTTDDYQTALRACFVQYGLPKAIQVDHDSVFINNTQASPFPTRLHLWLTALGIQLCFSRMNQPTDQAIVERSHQTIFQQALAEQSFKDWDACMHQLEQRRKILNQEAPCDSLGGVAPLVRNPQAAIPQRPFDISRESEYLDLQPVYDLLATGSWRRKISTNKTVSLADESCYLKQGIPSEMVDITFDPQYNKLRFVYGEEPKVAYKSLKRLTKEQLMGYAELGVPRLQLNIPLNYNFQVQNYQLRLFETIPVTT